MQNAKLLVASLRIVSGHGKPCPYGNPYNSHPFVGSDAPVAPSRAGATPRGRPHKVLSSPDKRDDTRASPTRIYINKKHRKNKKRARGLCPSALLRFPKSLIGLERRAILTAAPSSPRFIVHWTRFGDDAPQAFVKA